MLVVWGTRQRCIRYLCEFTDIIIIGGDGLFNQYINACYKHPHYESLIKIPIGILPGGSANALCCDIGGTEALDACINIIRGNIIKGDMLKVDFENKNHHTKPYPKSVLGSAITWGFTSQIVEASQGWRSVLGSSRYVFCGAKEVFCHGGFCSMRNHNIEKIRYTELFTSPDPVKPIDFNLIDSDERPTNDAFDVGNGENKETDHTNSDLDYVSIRNKIEEANSDFGEVVEERKISQDMISKENPADIDENGSAIGDFKYVDISTDWKDLDVDSVFFILLTTHECRRSGTNDIVAPFAKVNDGKMYIIGFKEASKFEALQVFMNIQNKGAHLDMEKLFYRQVTQIKFTPKSNTAFNIDGEIYDSDNITITSQPGLVNLLGKIIE